MGVGEDRYSTNRHEIGENPRKEAEPRSTKARIRDAAIDLFSRQGFKGTSVRELATAVGLTEGALYRHYAGKSAILEEILAHAEEVIFTPLPIEELLSSDGGPSVFAGLLRPLPAMFVTDAEDILKTMRVIYAEMYHDEKTRAFFKTKLIDQGNAYIEALFSRCVELGAIVPCDVKTLSRVFNAFRSEWAFNYLLMQPDGMPDEAEMMRDLDGPIRFFEEFFVPANRRGD